MCQRSIPPSAQKWAVKKTSVLLGTFVGFLGKKWGFRQQKKLPRRECQGNFLKKLDKWNLLAQIGKDL